MGKRRGKHVGHQEPGLDRFFDDLIGGNVFSKPRPIGSRKATSDVTKRKRLELWSRQAYGFYQSIPQTFWQQLEEQDVYVEDFGFSVTRVFGDREVHGQFLSDGIVYNAIAKLDSKAYDCWCGKCDVAFPQICVHGACFVSFLDDELERDQAPLSRRVLGNNWDIQKPARKDLLIDPIDRVEQEIKSMVDVLSTRWRTSDPLDQLPKLETQQEERIAWAIAFDGHEVEIKAVLQQRKKRGNGFTKGRKLSTEKLFVDRDLPLTRQDSPSSRPSRPASKITSTSKSDITSTRSRPSKNWRITKR